MASSVAAATGVNFFVVGDYGWVRDLTDTNLTFNAMDRVKGAAEPGSFDDADFIVTVGDNLYPLVDTEPTQEEFEEMLKIFQRPNLKDLKVHAVRGNHDAYFAWDAEIKLTGRNDQWYMPSLFYEKQVQIGKNGEKLGLLFVDSSLMLCATYSYAGDSGGHMLLMHEEHIRLRDVHCNTDEQQFWGNRQYEWINETLAGWQHDKDLVWKAAVLHHPLWGKWYPDFAPIVLNFLPILLDNQFDLYLCGHEHVVSYASYAYSQVPLPTLEGLKLNMKEHAMLEEYQCKADQESLFGKTSRKQTWLKGEALHQVVTGTSGYDEYQLCMTRASMGTFAYAQNILHAWSQVHADPNSLRVVSRGVDPTTEQFSDLYEIEIIRKHEDFII